MRFSQKIIADITAYYRKRCGVELTPEEAEEYLASFADLARCFKDSIREGFGGIGLPPKAAPDSEPSDLSLFSEQIRT